MLGLVHFSVIELKSPGKRRKTREKDGLGPDNWVILTPFTDPHKPIYQLNMKRIKEYVMAFGTTPDEYRKQRDLYDDYLLKSKIYRALRKTGRFVMWAILFIALFENVFIDFLEPVELIELFQPTFTLNYLYTFFSIILIFVGFFIAVFSLLRIMKIKREFAYNDIKRDYIFMYESFSAYNDYIENKTPVRKSDAIKCLEKSYEIIDELSYGNIPATLNPNIEKIDFIKKDLKQIIVSMMESKNTTDQYTARELLTYMIQFLYNKKTSFLNVVYESANKYMEKEDYVHHLISRKDLVIAYIANHQILSQFIFTFILLIVVIIIGKIVGATDAGLLAPGVAVVGTSFPIFNWIKSTVLKLES